MTDKTWIIIGSMPRKVSKTAAELEMDKYMEAARKWARANPIAAKYSHRRYDRATMKLPLNEDTYNYIVLSLVTDLWLREHWRRNVKTDEHHREYIKAYRSKYRFPDYEELVGSPQPEHYDEKGHLTTQRKATLMLIGVLDWRGLRMAKHQSVFGFHSDRARWGWGEEPPYKAHQKGWYVPIKKVRPGSKNIIVEDLFRPLRNYRCQRLEEFLTPHEKYTEVVLKDGDYYNCQPNNIEVVTARGRIMRCKFCGSSVTAATSKRFKWDGGTIRACFDCLTTMPATWRKPIF